MQYTIRQAKIEDLDILDCIHTKNMKQYVEKVYTWNPTLFREHFIPQNYQVIEAKNYIIGFIKIVLSDTEIYLAEIQIASNYQKQGIGSSILKSLIQISQINHKKLSLKVLKGNPAVRLYKRLGFTVVRESSTHQQMIIDNSLEFIV